MAIYCAIGVLLAACIVLAGWWVNKVNRQTPESAPVEVPDDCCGAHAVCERDSLLSKTDEVLYFDDEELDALRGIAAQDYTQKQIEQIEDVFFTLREQDVAGWVRSMQLRQIELPVSVRDQALLVVAERRERLAAAHSETNN